MIKKFIILITKDGKIIESYTDEAENQTGIRKKNKKKFENYKSDGCNIEIQEVEED